MPDLADPPAPRLNGGMTSSHSTLRLLLSISALTLGASSLEAQTIFALDFDPNSGNYQYGFAFAGYGSSMGGNVDLNASVSQVTEIAVGAGVGGSNALRITMDASAAGAQLPPDRTYDYLGFACAANTGFAQPLSSAQLADYTFTLDARADGFLTGVTSSTGELSISISAPDGTLGATDGNADLLIALRFATGVALATTFQTSVLNLGAAAITDGSLTNFANFHSTADQLTFTVAANEANAKFGFDAGNVIVVDNASLAVVPEPGSALVFTLGAFGVLAVRRRTRR